MNVCRNILAKPVGHEGEKSWSEEDQDDTDMGAIFVKSLEPGIPGRKIEDSL